MDINKNIEIASQKYSQMQSSRISYINPAQPAILTATWFYGMVHTGGNWDIKTKYNDLNYDDFGNFHYGATGLATGVFTQGQLLREAGRASVKDGNVPPPGENWGYPPRVPGSPFGGQSPFGDKPHDQEMIKKGFEYYQARQRGCV